MSDGYYLNTLIDAAQTIGNAFVETVKDVIDLLTEEQEDEEAQPKEEKYI